MTSTYTTIDLSSFKKIFTLELFVIEYLPMDDFERISHPTCTI